MSDLGTAARTPLFKEHGPAQAEPQSTVRDFILKSRISGSSISGFSLAALAGSHIELCSRRFSRLLFPC